MLAGVFMAALDEEARPRFDDATTLAATLTELHAIAQAAYPGIVVAAATFAAELARRLGAIASPDQLARVRTDHVYLAIACAAGDEPAIRCFQAEFLREIDASGARLRARADQVDEVRSQLSRILFVSEPGRPAAVSEFSGRGDLRSYVRVIATRELVRVLKKASRDIAVSNDAVLDMLSPTDDPTLEYLREHYRAEVDAAMRAALTRLGEQTRALLQYSLIDRWTVDRIGALYDVHRATAARWVGAAREELATALRGELASRLAISVEEVDSIVRLVQSRIDVSLERLLG